MLNVSSARIMRIFLIVLFLAIMLGRGIPGNDCMHSPGEDAVDSKGMGGPTPAERDLLEQDMGGSHQEGAMVLSYSWVEVASRFKSPGFRNSRFYEQEELRLEPGEKSSSPAEAVRLPSKDNDKDESGMATVASPGPPVERKPRVVEHTVQRGETLWDIASDHNIDVNTIVTSNPGLGDINRIAVGQKLRFPTVKGVIHRVTRGDNLWELSRAYGVDAGQIIAVNDISDPRRLRVGQELIVPGATFSLNSKRLVSPAGKLLRNFHWPARGRISSCFGPRWGRFHEGIDIAIITGTPVKAAAGGRVLYSGWSNGYGKIVIIDHGDEVQTRYAHNSRLLVKKGMYVKRGQVIARSGSTGRSTGPHLHFEIRFHGKPVNPLDYLIGS